MYKKMFLDKKIRPLTISLIIFVILFTVMTTLLIISVTNKHEHFRGSISNSNDKKKIKNNF
jgi:hypothetical protein